MMPSSKSPIRILIADDQVLQRQGFRMIIESQKDMVVVGEAGDGAQSLAIVRRVESDVVLMDIQMPRVNGLVAAERIGGDEQTIARFGRAPRIILMTAVDVDDHLAAAADTGVFAVLYKDLEPEALLSAIRGANSSHGQV
jgi:DNA-binding NarL/FixJ family response regulator